MLVLKNRAFSPQRNNAHNLVDQRSEDGICQLWCISGSIISRSCIFQPCDLVRHFPGPAFSSLCSFLVRHFQVLQIQRPLTTHVILYTVKAGY